MGRFSFGIPPNNIDPLRYADQQLFILQAVNYPRAPTPTDKNYTLFCIWRNSNVNAVLPDAEGDMWLLVKFIPSAGTILAVWKKISTGTTPGGTVITLSDTAGTKVDPDVTGNIQLVGGNGVSIVSNPGSNLLNITGITATTSQIGVTTLATAAQSEYNTYGTTQVVQSGNIPAMMSKPAPIGSVTPNTGAFTSLSSNDGQTFSAPLDTFPSESVTILQTSTSAPNVTIRTFVTCVTPGAITTDFGNAIELWGENTASGFQLLGSMIGLWDTPTAGSEVSNLLFRITNGGVNIDGMRLFADRLELAVPTRYRIGVGGIDFTSGTGDPNGTVTAAQGSLYMRLDGSSTSTRAYINTDGGTTWTNVVTAA